MKTIYTLIITFLLILTITFSNAQVPATITLVKSININDTKELFVDIDGEFITNSWSKENIVRIEMEIKTNDVSREVLKHLVLKGRYKVKIQELEWSTILSFPNIDLPAYINDRLLSENISYRFLVPENILIRVRSRDNQNQKRHLNKSE